MVKKLGRPVTEPLFDRWSGVGAGVSVDSNRVALQSLKPPGMMSSFLPGDGDKSITYTQIMPRRDASSGQATGRSIHPRRAGTPGWSRARHRPIPDLESCQDA